MRTAELCELLRVPHLVLDRPLAPRKSWSGLAVDYGPFLAQFRGLMMEWRLFLARNGLEVRPEDEEVPVADYAMA